MSLGSNLQAKSRSLTGTKGRALIILKACRIGELGTLTPEQDLVVRSVSKELV